MKPVELPIPGKAYPDQHQFFFRTAFRLTLAHTVGVTGIGVTLALMFFLNRSPGARFMKFTMSVGALMGLYCLSQVEKIQIETEGYLRDLSNISDQSYTNRIFQMLNPSFAQKPPAKEGGAEEDLSLDDPIVPWDWSELAGASTDVIPHIAIYGGTGSGKTMVTEYILSLLGGRSIVLTPKRKPTQWAGLNVVGYPRDGVPNMAAGAKEIRNALFDIYCEMNDRIEEMGRGIEDQLPLNVVLEEWPAVSQKMGSHLEYFKELVRMAREGRIRLIMLAQGMEVETLGIKGQGSIRDNFTEIYLTQFAKKKGKQIGDPDVILELKKHGRCCLVDGRPGGVPDLGGRKYNIATVEDLSTLGKNFKEKYDRHLWNIEMMYQEAVEVYRNGGGKGEPSEKQLILEIWNVADTKSPDYATARMELGLVKERMAKKGTLI